MLGPTKRKAQEGRQWEDREGIFHMSQDSWMEHLCPRQCPLSSSDLRHSRSLLQRHPVDMHSSNISADPAPSGGPASSDILHARQYSTVQYNTTQYNTI
jgi:hypothetical protein